MYRPKDINELRTPAMLLTPTFERINGVRTPGYSESSEVIYCNFKTYGGTESTVNGIISYIDTALVTTWYRPDITADCAIKLESGAIFRIISPPENVEEQCQYLQFKVERVKGK